VTGDPGDLDLQLAGDLVPRPDLDAGIFHQDDGVQRLQRRVGDIGGAVLGLDHPVPAKHCVHVTVIAPDAVEVIVGKAFAQEAPVILLLGRVGAGPQS
jgi:hypothetical protein